MSNVCLASEERAESFERPAVPEQQFVIDIRRDPRQQALLAPDHSSSFLIPFCVQLSLCSRLSFVLFVFRLGSKFFPALPLSARDPSHPLQVLHLIRCATGSLSIP